MSKADTGGELLESFFSKPVCQKATVPLKKGVEITVQIPGEDAMTLRREKDRLEVLRQPAQKPDMSFEVPRAALEVLNSKNTEEVGEIGIEILKLMADSDETRRIKAKVHIGPVDLYWHGYLGVLALGGQTVMKFLASKGFTGISKIREGIAKFRE